VKDAGDEHSKMRVSHAHARVCRPGRQSSSTPITVLTVSYIGQKLGLYMW